MKNKGVSKLFLRVIDAGPEVDTEAKAAAARGIAEGFLGEAVDRRQHWLAEAWPVLSPLVLAFSRATRGQAIGVVFLLVETIGLETIAEAIGHLRLAHVAWPWLAERVHMQASHEDDFESSAHRVGWLLYRLTRDEAYERDAWVAFGAALAAVHEAEADLVLCKQLEEGEEPNEAAARTRVLFASVERLVQAFGAVVKEDAGSAPGVLAGLRSALPQELRDERDTLPRILEKLRAMASAPPAVPDQGDALPPVLEGQGIDAHAAGEGEWAAQVRAGREDGAR